MRRSIGETWNREFPKCGKTNPEDEASVSDILKDDFSGLVFGDCPSRGLSRWWIVSYIRPHIWSFDTMPHYNFIFYPGIEAGAATAAWGIARLFANFYLKQKCVHRKQSFLSQFLGVILCSERRLSPDGHFHALVFYWSLPSFFLFSAGCAIGFPFIVSCQSWGADFFQLKILLTRLISSLILLLQLSGNRLKVTFTLLGRNWLHE